MGNVASPKNQPEKSQEETANNKEDEEELQMHDMEGKEGQVPKVVKDILSINDPECADSSIPKTTKATKLKTNGKNIYGFEKTGSRKYWVLRLLYNSRRSEDIPEEERGLFLVKTFAILIVCLSVTIYIAWHAYDTKSFRDYFETKNGKYLIYFSIAAYIIILFALMFSQCTTIEPGNLIVLVLAVISFSVFIVIAIMKYNRKEIVYALLATVLVVFGLLLLATIDYDFTKWYTYLVVLALVLFVLTILFTVTKEKYGEKSSTKWMIWCFAGTTYYCMCITIQTQLILLGKSIEMDESHYVVAAVLLYMSVAVIFLEVARFIMLYIQDDVRWR